MSSAPECAGNVQPRTSAVELRRWLAASLVVLLAMAAAIIAWRRLAGGLTTPLAPAPLVLAGFLLTALAAAVRTAWRNAWQTQHAARCDRRVMILTTVSLLVLGLSLSLRGSHPAGLAAFWAMLIVGEGWAWRRGAGDGEQGTESGERRVESEEVADGAGHGDDPYSQFPIPNSQFDHNVLQQLTLGRDADGSQRLAGRLRLPVAAGQRTGSIHVAFCPPFAAPPELTVEQIDGPEARIKTAQLLPYGARLDLKLAAPAAETGSVVLEFAAVEEKADESGD